MPQFSRVEIINGVGKAIGRHRKEINSQLDAIRQQISSISITDRMLNLVQRGLNAILEEAKQDGDFASKYCERRYQKAFIIFTGTKF